MTTARPRFSAGSWLALAIAVAALSRAEGGGAQIAVQDGGRWRLSLREADEALADGNQLRAVEILQRVMEFGEGKVMLDTRPEADPETPVKAPAAPRPARRVVVRDGGAVFLRNPTRITRRHASTVWVSAAEIARRRVASLPASALALYRETFEPRARDLLERATRSGDDDLVSAVARRFASTPSGMRARASLADRYFARGWFRRSMRLLDDLLRELPGGDADAVDRETVHLRLLATLRALGETEVYARERLRFVRGDADARELMVRQMESQVAAASRPDAVVAPMNGGARSYVSELPSIADRPYRVEWKSSLWASRMEYGVAPVLQSSHGLRVYNDVDSSQYLVFHPTVSGSDVFLSGVFHLWRMDLESGILTRRGLRKGAMPPNVQGYQEAGVSPLYSVTMSGDIAYTTTISDRILPTHYMRYQITADLPMRALIAIDTKSWKPLWDTRKLHVGSLEDPKLISVVSPPVVRDDRLYVAGVYQAGFYTGVVMALDPEDGSIVWQTRVASNQHELTMFGEPAREPFATVIAEDEGILYYVSQLGVVAALEARDGRVLWLTTYHTIDVDATIGPQPVLRDLVWGTNPPLFADGVLYAAPRDGDALYMLDTGLGAASVGDSTESSGPGRRAGHLVGTPAPFLNSGDRRDVIGYRRGKLYFGGNGIRALDVSRVAESGGIDKVGGAARRASGEVVGRAAMTREGIIYSTPGGLMLVDYELERVRSLVSFRGVSPGNVLVVGDRVLVTSRRETCCFVPVGPVEREGL